MNAAAVTTTTSDAAVIATLSLSFMLCWADPMNMSDEDGERVWNDDDNNDDVL